MAVIIDGWDKLPQNCYDCDLHNYHECALTSNSIEDYYNGETREPHCPLKEVPIGNWIEKDGKEEGYDIGGVKTWYIQIKCNRCGFIKTAIEGHAGQYKYCPSCGSLMVEEQQGEE